MHRNFERFAAIALPFALHLISHSLAYASTILPYSTRLHPYNGWSASPQGDIRTVGMAGATFGLADSFIATQSNPAGLAMTLNGADANLAGNTIHDSSKQAFENHLNAHNLGVALNHYPWGFSLGYIATTHESQAYMLSSLNSTVPASLSVATQEFSLSFARILFENRLSLGASFILSQGENAFRVPDLVNTGLGTLAVSGNFGASYRLPYRLILGSSYKLPVNFNVDPANHPMPLLPGYYQTIKVPGQFGLGLGWIPNRFFRGDLSVLFVGAIDNATLLKDDTTAIGRAFSVQPRIGFAYTILDYKELKTTVFAGTYYEVSRIQNSPNRLHLNTGIEIKPWIFALGTAIDASTRYRNYLLSFGVDVVRVLEKLEFIPAIPQPPSVGSFPTLVSFLPDGLPGPIIQSGKPKAAVEIDPIKISQELPDKIKEKAKELGQGIKSVVKLAYEPDVKKKNIQPKPKNRIKKARKTKKREEETPSKDANSKNENTESKKAD